MRENHFAMGRYRFEVQTGADGSTELLDDRHEFDCATNLAAIREARVLLSRLRGGVAAKLFDPTGSLIWMDVAD